MASPSALSSRLPAWMAGRLRLPVIAAPMLRVSGPELVIAACQAGVVGAFPTANARGAGMLADWLTTIAAATTVADAPPAANLIIRQPDLAEHLDVLVRHRVELVITSAGSPAEVVGPLHEVGALVFADVETLKHARRAISASVDGLVLRTAGAGGQTGWLNPFAFVRAVRESFDGPIVLAGGVCDGQSLWAAQVLGCDLAYLGASFAATRESMATPECRRMLVDSSLDDIVLTKAFTGLNSNMPGPVIGAAGRNPDSLDGDIPPAEEDRFPSGTGPEPAADLWWAGHSVSGVRGVLSAGELVDQVRKEYLAAREQAR